MANEIKQWREFNCEGENYSFSHLNSHKQNYIDPKDSKTYSLIVTYSCHCFTEKKCYDKGNEKILRYPAPNEVRYFSYERYAMSKRLPEIVESLGSPGILTAHAGYGNYAAVKFKNDQGKEINYYVVFKVFREKKKLRMHILSAYPKDELGRVLKVNFFVIISNLLRGKPLPRPSK